MFPQTNFYFFNTESMKSAKINFLNVYPVFSLPISLMTLIVPTFMSFSGYCFKGTNCWEHDFSLNLFSRNMLWQFYTETGNAIQQKFPIVKIFAMKSAKINSLNVYPVFSFPISLMTPIVPTFMSFSGYCFKGNCWEHDFLLNLFSRNMLEWLYPETGNPIQQKFPIVKIFAKNQMLLRKSKTKYLDSVFASSIVQRAERLLNFVQSIEWIVNIKQIPNIE